MYDTSKQETLLFRKKCGGGAVCGVWRKKLDHGKGENYVLIFLMVSIPIQ